MAAPIGCTEAVNRLWAYLDGRLEPPSREAVERHLAWCVRCCGELAFAEELQRLLRRRSAVTLPEDVRARLERFVDALGGTDEEVPT